MSEQTVRLTSALADRYRIERELGMGGMATVYLAHDLKHDRKVAIKVLKPELAAVLGAERFVQEIKTTAALSHPHILPLFDSGESGGFLFYVMPYIQGETIREKLNRETQCSVDEALRITSEIADALDYAHRQGVIHRDIKPENLLLHDGRAMVMDFGIALAVSAAAGGRMTETGLSLGTPHYMSPEQATADKQITGRSDVYSLASVCYEMLTGNPPHVGSSAQQIIMKIITEPAASVTTHRKTVPANVAAALAKALEKLPADRFETAKAFKDALTTGGYTYATAAQGAGDATPGGASGGRRGSRVLAGVMTVLALAAGAAAYAGWTRPTPEPPFRRLDLSFGTLIPLTGSDPAVSHDGTMIAVAGQLNGETAIYLRRLDGDAEFRKVAGTEGGMQPAFSPDDQWIAFRNGPEATLVKVRVSGGGAVTLVAGTYNPYHPHWGPDNRIAFSGPAGNGIVSAAGGDAAPLKHVTARRPFLLPDRSGVLSSENGDLRIYDFAADSSLPLMIAGRHPIYVAPGYLIYSSVDDAGLFAVTFDLAARRVTSEPVRVLERVGAGIGTRGIAYSESGTLVHFDADGVTAGATNHLVVMDSSGKADTLRIPPARFYYTRFSKDGRHVAVEVATSSRSGATDIYTLDLVTGTYTQLTFEGDNDQPAWSPDGQWIAYDAVKAATEQVCIKRADNSGPERCNPNTGVSEIGVEAWLDDSTILYTGSSTLGAADIFTVSTAADAKPRPYAVTPFAENDPRVSPDRSLIAYVSQETGATQLWLRDFPTPQGKWNVSQIPARAPRWSPDGRYLYFVRSGAPDDTLYRVRVDRTPAVVVREPEVVRVVNIDGWLNWDLHPDGKRFVLPFAAAVQTAQTGTRPAARFLLLENWPAELKRQVTPPPQ